MSPRRHPNSQHESMSCNPRRYRTRPADQRPWIHHDLPLCDPKGTGERKAINRELKRRIQAYRKEAGLDPSDYWTDEDCDKYFDHLIGPVGPNIMPPPRGGLGVRGGTTVKKKGILTDEALELLGLRQLDEACFLSEEEDAMLS